MPAVALTAKDKEKPESGTRPDRWRGRKGPRPPLAPGQVAKGPGRRMPLVTRGMLRGRCCGLQVGDPEGKERVPAA